eukprot:15455497-Alexandrium_andersonii.AAC.1
MSSSFLRILASALRSPAYLLSSLIISDTGMSPSAILRSMCSLVLPVKMPRTAAIFHASGNSEYE